MSQPNGIASGLFALAAAMLPFAGCDTGSATAQNDPPRFRREMLTSEIESLAGKRVRIRGYILPTAQSRGIKRFVLVRDNLECCFGPGAALYDCILVEMQPGKTAEYSVRPVAVEGIFRIELRTDIDGNPQAIYGMKAEAVRR
jgi:hypothetical protein